MVCRVYERVAESFDHCWVATDDMRIYRAVEEFGGRVVMTSDRHRSGTERCREALDLVEAAEGMKFDVVVNVQGDEPFVSSDHLGKIMRPFERDPHTPIATLVKPFAEGEDIFNPNTPKVAVAADGRALYFSRSVIPCVRGAAPADWSRRHVYYKHIGMYAYRSDVLRAIVELPPSPLEEAESLEQLRWIEHGVRICAEVTQAETVAVDTPEDLRRILGMSD